MTTVRNSNCKKFLFFTYILWVALISTVSLNELAVAEQTSEPPVKSAAVANADHSNGQPESTPSPTEFRQPPFQQLRYLEDYGYLQDKSLRREPLDRLKYLPLRKGKPDWYLSIGGEMRQRYEAFRNDNWGRAPDDSNGYLLQRYMLHTDWHFGKNVRAFVQLRSNVEAGRVGGPRPVVDENKLDFNQAFVDLSFGAVKKPKSLYASDGKRWHSAPDAWSRSAKVRMSVSRSTVYARHSKPASGRLTPLRLNQSNLIWVFSMMAQPAKLRFGEWAASGR